MSKNSFFPVCQKTRERPFYLSPPIKAICASVYFFTDAIDKESGILSGRFHPDAFAVEGDGHFKDVGDSGSLEGGGVLLVFYLPESGF